MFEALTGKPPFADDNPIKTILSHLNEIPKNLRKDFPNLDIPTDLATIIRRCLEKDPGERYQSMAELRRDLEAVREGKSLNKTPISRKQAIKRLARYSRLGIFTTVALTLLVALPMVIISGYYFVQMTTPAWTVQYHKGIDQLTMRNLGGSRSFFLKALKSAESGHAPDKDLELIYMGLGAVDCQIANYTHARPSLEHALTLNRRHEVDLARAGALELLSDCDVKLGNFKQAVLESGEAVTVVRQLCGTNSQQTANALSHLAPSYRRDGQYAQAEKANREEIGINLKLHPDKQFQQLADAYSERANIKSAQKETSEAIEAARNSLDINRDQQGKDGPTTQGVALWLIKYLIAHNQKEEATRLAQEYNIKIDNLTSESTGSQ
jgi:tetratricopeptide (TPR) repeat protein